VANITPELTEAERIVHRVLRGFLRNAGWKPADYLAVEVRQPTHWEHEPGRTTERDATPAPVAEAPAAQPSTPELTEAERIVHRVLRGFLRNAGWKPADYLAVEVRQPTHWEHEPDAAAARGKTLAGQLGRRNDAPDALLRIGILLDQQRARVELLQAVLPERVVEQSAMACLLLGRSVLRAGEYREAAALLLQGVAIDPTLSELHRELGLALRHQHRITEAVLHLEMSLLLRRGTQHDNQVPHPDHPVLVARPNPSLDIYAYQHQYYIVPRDDNFVEPKVIGGELLRFQKNAAYKIARFLIRGVLIPLLRLRIVKRLRAFFLARIGRSTLARPNQESMIHSWIGALLKQLALFMFARRINQRAVTIMDALQLAGERLSEPEPSKGYGESTGKASA